MRDSYLDSLAVKHTGVRVPEVKPFEFGLEKEEKLSEIRPHLDVYVASLILRRTFNVPSYGPQNLAEYMEHEAQRAFNSEIYGELYKDLQTFYIDLRNKGIEIPYESHEKFMDILDKLK